MRCNVRIYVVLLAICLTLVGCTEDKAQALKTAAEAFRDKAVDAIDSLSVTKRR